MTPLDVAIEVFLVALQVLAVVAIALLVVRAVVFFRKERL